MNLYAYAGNNPVSFSDPFGLEADTAITYNEYGQEIGREGDEEENQYYLEYNGTTYQLDYGLVEGSTPYEVNEDLDGTYQAAIGFASSAPIYGNRLSIAFQSRPGGPLDFKTQMPDRSLWKIGGGLLAHKHAVANIAWGNYMSRRGYPVSTALRGATLQGGLRGGEDPLDQRMIRRGYALNR